MRIRWIVFLGALACFAVGCSPRDFLTRRLTRDLIAGSDTFKSPQLFWLRTGVVSNKDYTSPEYLVLQHKGWITGANVACAEEGRAGATRSARNAPLDCWEVALTPIGVETFHDLIPKDSASSQRFSVPVARRELVAITGISSDGTRADVDFAWKWIPLNEVGAALYTSGVQYNSTVTFKHYDDGWRIIDGAAPRNDQGLDDALKNSVPVS